ncbi:XRE family transcriptional regulator [Lactiplantibacillus plantarum]|uniref:helix-turn-helix domain-containing protein n=1 Tax=Lactiplantibacillus plantarum TaxID=1590 RepID=UPI00062A3F72|nr:helix-turn-helix transcriptional regulator [Lactiplantibacillus plantarum]AQY71185.1 transcriptional regulator [Lactiplantibacillus plantarum]KZT98086.1 hypothetical protein Nizo2258_1401 [Lactiplantibacillus plantarum]KZU00352.1 hypothetical protein Nizo2257_0651 [Lactiplantibacillus plantarum]MBS0954791.1 helix-turn-helix transcriptional regulator [Lactiplantibacillus plantarum]MCG0636592.1 XRE family transcriptional regulator [Lactiplantibacillus plantarum]
MKTRIGELRREHGLTLKQLGQKIHVKDNALSQYETGKRNPQLGLLVEIAKFFKVSLEYLICESDKRDYSIASDQEAINLLQLLDNRKVIFDNLSNETALRLAVWIENHNELLSSEYPELLKTAKWFTYETIDEADILKHFRNNRIVQNDAFNKIEKLLVLDYQDDNIDNPYYGPDATDVLEFMRQGERIGVENYKAILEEMKAMPSYTPDD